MAAPQLGFGPFIRPIGLGGFGGRFIGRPFIGTPYYGRGFYPGGFYGGPFRRGFIGKKIKI